MRVTVFLHAFRFAVTFLRVTVSGGPFLSLQNCLRKNWDGEKILLSVSGRPSIRPHVRGTHARTVPYTFPRERKGA